LQSSPSAKARGVFIFQERMAVTIAPWSNFVTIPPLGARPGFRMPEKIRHFGYLDKWHQACLGDIRVIFTGKSPLKKGRRKSWFSYDSQFF
jgi:hypothetical protein